MSPQPAYHDWPTKAEVVRDLGSGFSLRNLEYMIQSGKIQVARRPVPGRRPATVCNPADVARIASERWAVRPTVETGGAIDLRFPPSLPALSSLPSLTESLGALKSLMPPRVALKEKLYLTIDEAVEYSGLPTSYLHKLIREMRLDAIKADRWLRISRKSLERL